MTFISYEFLIFFGVVCALYFNLKHGWQNRLLLLASYVFYGWWDWRFLGLIAASTATDFICGQLAEHNGKRSHHRRKLAVVASVVVNLGILATFKYYGFFVESLADVASAVGLELHVSTWRIILPVGISFYTFQTLSYTVDVYRGDLGAARNPVDFALYVSFFPQLVAGPIERGKALLPQMTHPRSVTADKVYSGAQLMLVGFFKKMVIADNVATVANEVFNTANPSAGAVIVGTYAFAFQIYCDFSGYTDIARGAARILGFDICENFRLPYLATTPSDFWRRWHISLSSWLRDYLYIPLGGNKRGATRTAIYLAITMLLGGLWHGAAWNFVIWGAYHGVLLAVFRPFRRPEPATRSGALFWLKVAGFFQLTCLGWLIFRVQSITQLRSMLGALVTDVSFAGVNAMMLGTLAVAAVPLMIFQVWQHRADDMEPWVRWPTLARVVFYVVLFYGIVLFGAPVGNAFIYFQF